MRKSKPAILLTTTLMCVLLILCTLSANAAVLFGDTDLDGKVSIVDATYIQRHLAQLTQLSEEQIEVAKVSGNDKLSIIDATFIQRKLAQLIDKFPVEENSDMTTPTTEPGTETQASTETVAPTQAETLTKVSSNVEIHFSNTKKWSNVYAYIYNYETKTLYSDGDFSYLLNYFLAHYFNWCAVDPNFSSNFSKDHLGYYSYQYVNPIWQRELTD